MDILKQNLIDINDYIQMRENKLASSVKWKQVRSLNVPSGGTFWQLFTTLPDYMEPHEPSLTQLRQIKELLL